MGLIDYFSHFLPMLHLDSLHGLQFQQDSINLGDNRADRMLHPVYASSQPELNK